MVDIDELVRLSLESPIASPPELSRIARMAERHRRRRVARRAAAGLAVVGLVSVGVLTVVRFDPGGAGHVRVVTPQQSGTQTSEAPTTTDFTTADLIDELAGAGARVVDDGTAPGAPLATTARLLCVDGSAVRVYEYNDVASRVAVSNTISADGSHVGNAIVEWIGPPHFFARGRIIALTLGDDAYLLGLLTGVLGPSLSPDAGGSGTLEPSCGDASP